MLLVAQVLCELTLVQRINDFLRQISKQILQTLLVLHFPIVEQLLQSLFVKYHWLTSTTVYHIPEGKHGPADGHRPILMSYLDVVVQGYLQVFGAEGGQHFFDTTAGWDGPILNDRAQPLYPRAQLLREEETSFVDRALAKMGARIVTAEG